MVSKQEAVTVPAIAQAAAEMYEQKGRLVPFNAEQEVRPLDFDEMDKAVDFTADNFILSMFASQRDDFKKFVNNMKSELALDIKGENEALARHLTETTFSETEINELMLAMITEEDTDGENSEGISSDIKEDIVEGI